MPAPSPSKFIGNAIPPSIAIELFRRIEDCLGRPYNSTAFLMAESQRRAGGQALNTNLHSTLAELIGNIWCLPHDGRVVDISGSTYSYHGFGNSPEAPRRSLSD
jgi:hypothetical protein